jgi:hypothetical protein
MGKGSVLTHVVELASAKRNDRKQSEIYLDKKMEGIYSHPQISGHKRKPDRFFSLLGKARNLNWLDILFWNPMLLFASSSLRAECPNSFGCFSKFLVLKYMKS